MNYDSDFSRCGRYTTSDTVVSLGLLPKTWLGLQPDTPAIQYSEVYVYIVRKDVNIANLISVNANIFPYANIIQNDCDPIVAR